MGGSPGYTGLALFAVSGIQVAMGVPCIQHLLWLSPPIATILLPQSHVLLMMTLLVLKHNSHDLKESHIQVGASRPDWSTK